MKPRCAGAHQQDSTTRGSAHRVRPEVWNEAARRGGRVATVLRGAPEDQRVGVRRVLVADEGGAVRLSPCFRELAWKNTQGEWCGHSKHIAQRS